MLLVMYAESDDDMADLVHDLTARGFQIEHQTDDETLVVKRKTFNVPLAVLGTLLLGIGLVIYLLYYRRKDDTWVRVVID